MSRLSSYDERFQQRSKAWIQDSGEVVGADEWLC